MTLLGPGLWSCSVPSLPISPHIILHHPPFWSHTHFLVMGGGSAFYALPITTSPAPSTSWRRVEGLVFLGSWGWVLTRGKGSRGPLITSFWNNSGLLTLASISQELKGALPTSCCLGCSDLQSYRSLEHSTVLSSKSYLGLNNDKWWDKGFSYFLSLSSITFQFLPTFL